MPFGTGAASGAASILRDSGEMFLADNVGNRGHRTRTISRPARVLFEHLPPQTDIGA